MKANDLSTWLQGLRPAELEKAMKMWWRGKEVEMEPVGGDIREGKIKLGGQKGPPTMPRPEPPRGTVPDAGLGKVIRDLKLRRQDLEVEMAELTHAIVVLEKLGERR